MKCPNKFQIFFKLTVSVIYVMGTLTLMEALEFQVNNMTRNGAMNLFNNNEEFLCITHTVEHIYISPSSTVGTTR